MLYARLLVEDANLLQADLVEGLGSTLSVNGVQLTSRHDRIRETRFQADSSVVHSYGTGLGDLQVELLGRTGLERMLP